MHGIHICTLAVLLLAEVYAANGQRLQVGDAWFSFGAGRGGSIEEVRLLAGPALAEPGQRTTGFWRVELGLGEEPGESWPPADLAPATMQRLGDQVRLDVTGRGLRMLQTYSPWPGAAGIVGEAWLVNGRDENIVVGCASFTLSPISIGGEIVHDEYVYPPGVFQHLRGPVSEATPEAMSSRYIYGCLQQTDKLMLPLAMVCDERARAAVCLACRNDEAVARVGVIGGEAGQLQSRFGIYRTAAPGETVYLGRIGIGLWRAASQSTGRPDCTAALSSFRDACQRANLVERPAVPPTFVKNLQIAWIGPFCPPYNTFDDIRARLPEMAAGGINALIVGGRTWYCVNSLQPELPDFLPILRNGCYVADDIISGGDAGLRRLVSEAHRLGMKLFCWGPTLAGVSLQSPEASAEPDWWIYRADGEFNFWYPTLAPPDASSEGWRRFVVATVERYISYYGLDGCWLDSAWKDHGLNFRSPRGWFGGPNGAKLSLMREIRRHAKALKPDFVIMAESGGAETASVADLWYVRMLGVFPLVPPERMQEVVMTEEACRRDDVRPFGQFQVDPGPLGNPHPVRRSLLLPDSYKAVLFLNNTLPRVPAYFVGDPLAGLLDEPELGQAVRQMLATRRQCPELINGKVVFDDVRSSAPQLVRFWRDDGRSLCLVIVNCAPETVTALIKLSGPLATRFAAKKRVRDVLSQASLGPLVVSADRKTVELEAVLPGYRGAILRPY